MFSARLNIQRQLGASSGETISRLWSIEGLACHAGVSKTEVASSDDSATIFIFEQDARFLLAKLYYDVCV